VVVEQLIFMKWSPKNFWGVCWGVKLPPVLRFPGVVIRRARGVSIGGVRILRVTAIFWGRGSTNFI